MRFEGGEGGRLLEVYTDEAGGAFEVGRVLAWKPGDRLVFEWRGNNFEPGLVTEVEVRFERRRAAAPASRSSTAAGIACRSNTPRATATARATPSRA